MELYQLLRQPYYEAIKEELEITRDNIKNLDYSRIDTNKLRKAIGLVQVLHSSFPELQKYVNLPILSSTPFEFGLMVKQYFTQKIEPFPRQYLIQRLQPIFDVFEIVDIGIQIERIIDDNVSFVIVLPNGGEKTTTLYDKDYILHDFYIFSMSYLNCYQNEYFKRLDYGKHSLHTSHNNILVLFRGKENSIDELADMIKSESENYSSFHYNSHEIIKLFFPNKLYYPCKGRNCKHTQCYDIETMISHVIQYETCPCGKRCSFNEIVIDSHFIEIMKMAKEDDWCVEVNNDKIVQFYSYDDGKDLNVAIEID
ncbi:hypothetical protein EDI_009440 [Entamoeba dispar SAW760]|uniref:SP-RING-type domain-containing protein n=1 Tax=Entamoeba dispar (strain ATCC PRA-260 / SAW760) TaxID=370354 RepID=B0EFI8_ENTDS|nr:uncharacterized protein EDI_009440 [Entamoeba dispar SAW760]EDR26708.1 hypothetical protein EDI_009440 [Entamoeba dispar SAW760]|eukprot:EDR26708.1 hypothetical protein EDI_009440 [Entamoeba dispar SAW760]